MVDKFLPGIVMEFLDSKFLTNPTWFLISIFEAILIIILIIRSGKQERKLAFSDISRGKIKDSQKQTIDMNNVMNSINRSQVLYKELSRSCHPDRFQNEEQKKIAENIFKEISQNKRNYAILLDLKSQAIKELEINN